jgi:hypothetical protein
VAGQLLVDGENMEVAIAVATASGSSIKAWGRKNAESVIAVAAARSRQRLRPCAVTFRSDGDAKQEGRDSNGGSYKTYQGRGHGLGAPIAGDGYGSAALGDKLGEFGATTGEFVRALRSEFSQPAPFGFVDCAPS